MRRAGRGMNDHRKINFRTSEGRFRRLSPGDALQWHHEAREFIGTARHKQRASDVPRALKTLVVNAQGCRCVGFSINAILMQLETMEM